MTDRLRSLGRLEPYPRTTLETDTVAAARALLGALLVHDPADGSGRTVARIVETEAYRQDDPASHTYGRRTPRVEPMFGPPGTAYVYRSYGIHRCLNVSTEPAGIGAAVLLRAAIPLDGTEVVRRRRPTARTDRDLLRGPGNLCQGLGVALDHSGAELLGDGPLRLVHDGWKPEADHVTAGPRVGVRLAADVAWRFALARVPEVSRYVRSPRAPTLPTG